MSRQPYFTSQHIQQLRRFMTDGEWSVLRDVATTRLATATGLQRLQALRAPMPTRTFRRLLQRLHDHDVLFRLDRSVGGRSAGSSGYVYGVGRAGQRLLDQPPRRPWTPRPSWLNHALATSELYVHLREAEASSKEFRLTEFEAEPICWRTFVAPGGGISDLKPDAFIQLETNEFIDRYFIEIDMGTESPTTIRRKATVYAEHRRDVAERPDDEVYPWVLWLVPDERRANVLREALATIEDSELHRVDLQRRAAAAVLDDPP